MAAKLNALMPLRFIGVSVVIVAHTFHEFGFYKFTPIYSQIITFFFVLSGFILTYVYPTLTNWEAVTRFWFARFARIWPLHFMAFLLVLFVLPQANWTPPTNHQTLVTLANLLLVHAWIPIRDFAVSYNAPAWSTSTEIFFYLLFPFLIQKIHQTWPWKLLCALSLVLIAIFIINPFFDHSYTLYLFMFLNPLARLFEFVLGMVTALVWRKIKPLIQINIFTATLIETFIVVMMIMIIVSYTKLFPYTGTYAEWKFDAGFVWLIYSSAAPIFALLILVLALEKGYISYLLSFPFMIFLGEISFSLYLIHDTFLYYYILHKNNFAFIPSWLVFIVYLCITLLSSILTWYVIERPCRRFIISLWPANKNQYAISNDIVTQRT